jgi:hypothetical protein
MSLNFDDRHLFVAFSTFTGDPAPFDTWYDEEHIAQILSAPGMIGAQRFVLADTKPLPGSESLDLGHLALYDIDGDPKPFRAEVKRQLMSGEMVLPDFLVPPFKTLILKPVSVAFEPEHVDNSLDRDDRHLFLAWVRHTGDAATLGRWYDEVHIPQVLSVPGMLRVQRFRQADVKPLPGVVTPDLDHLTLCEMAGDPAPFREEMKRLLVSGELEFPDFVVPPVATMFMRPVSPYWAAAGSPAA